MKSERGLTPKQEAFVREYLVDLNATQAAIRAGYSAKTAYSQGQRLLKHADVQKNIQAGKDTRAQRVELTADFVIGGLREVAQRCMQRVPVMVGQGKERRQAVNQDGEGVWEFDSAGANRSLELLGKHLGIFKDLTGEQDAPPVARVEIKVTDARKG